MKHPYKRLNVNGKIMLQHRYLMELQLGRPLTNKELVHHKDKNPTNNDLKNLQLIDIKKHNYLHHKKEVEYIKLICPICKKSFIRNKNKYLWAIKKGTKDFYCSRKCKNKMQEKNINIEYFNKIKEGMKNNMTGYQISKKYCLNLGTVYNYLKKMDYIKVKKIPKFQNGLFRCSYCKRFLQKKEYSRNNRNNYGIRCRCKECTKLTNKRTCLF